MTRASKMRMLLLLSAALLGPQAGPGFTDASRESGLSAMLDAHYAKHPKWWMTGSTLVDLDADGDLDLHLATHGNGPPAFATNDGKGRFAYAPPDAETGERLLDRRGAAGVPYPGGEIRMVYDFDEDGRPDAHVQIGDGGGLGYRNLGQALKPLPSAAAFSGDVRAVGIADLDRDGRADLFWNGHGGAKITRLFLGRPGGAWEESAVRLPSLPEDAGIPVDVNGDGRLDLLLSQRGYRPAERRVFLGEGGLQFRDVTREAGLDPAGGSIHGAGDLDLDGDLDLICVEGSAREPALEIYLNDGKGGFERKPGAVKVQGRPPGTNWGGAVVTDFDNDGIPDVIVNGRYACLILRGTGGANLAQANREWGLPQATGSAVDEGLCFGDVDADGDLDLVLWLPEKRVGLFRNDLPARGWVRVRPVGAPGNRAAAGAKIRVTEPGTGKLLGFDQVAIWSRQCFHSYYSRPFTERHFGLGTAAAADVRVEFYPSGKVVERKGVRPGTEVELREEP